MARVVPVGYRRSAVGMTARRAWWRRAPGALIVSASLLAAPLQANAWGPAADGLLHEADAHRKKGEHRAAADKYAAYYRAQAEAKRASGTGAYIVEFAVGSYLAAFEVSEDIAELEACHGLLREFLGEVVRVHGSAEQAFTEEARARLQEVEAKISAKTESESESELESESESESESGSGSGSESESESETQSAPAPAPGATDVAPSRGPDKLGIGLVVGGSIVVLGGVGMLVGATQYLPVARERLAEAEAQNEGTGMTPDRDAYLSKAEGRRNLMLGLGAAVVALGLVPTIWGAVRLARHRSKSTARLAIGPAGGLSLHGSF